MSENNFVHKEMEEVLALFPKEFHDALRAATCAAACYHEEHARDEVEEDYTKALGQKPEYGRVLGGVDPMAMPSVQGSGKEFIFALGTALIDENGALIHEASVYSELLGAYKVPLLQVEKYIGGKFSIAKEDSALRAKLEKVVKERGFDYYKNFGVPLGENEEENREMCLAAQLGFDEMRAFKEKSAAHPHLHLPQPVLMLRHPEQSGQTFLFEDKVGKFRKVPVRKNNPNFDKEYARIQNRFPDETMQRLLTRVIEEQALYAEGRQELPLVSKGCRIEGRCSDSRETPPAAMAREEVGRVIYIRHAGGFFSDGANEKLLPSVERLYAEAAARGDHVFGPRQHSGCGAMNAIYTYHKSEEGLHHIKEHYGPAFVYMALARKKLYERVLNNIKTDEKGLHDFSYYESMGIAMTGNKDKDIPLCMALEQGLVDYALVEKEFRKYKNGPQPLLVFSHVYEHGVTYAFNPKERGFIRLPSLPLLPKAPQAKVGSSHATNAAP